MDADVRRHVPVMLREVVEALAPRPEAVIIDGTFGAGGYTAAFLSAGASVLAIDRDPSAVAAGQPMAAAAAGRLTLVEARFSELAEIAVARGFDRVDGVALDIGVSSMQLDEAARGFSFQATAPLDMRMSGEGVTAADLLADTGESELADIIYQYGEERRSRAIARAIVKARGESPIRTTSDLVRIVTRVLGPAKHDGRHPATRTFQALRIAVNDELGELERALAAAERILKPGGRLAVVSFHSLEDRIVKQFLQERSGRVPSRSRFEPPDVQNRIASFEIVNPRPLTATEDEVTANPRARSAKLRAAIRTAAEPMG